ncbi:RING-14 protein [Stachybotrys elegans]|uniref:RING-14 protein n=1 Tax=Stachybotrys elegans TaxID=80388 RepID=A0A8K0T3S3_9HYPO|nr:RING-14 protein [Stachybotrys elegans]
MKFAHNFRASLATQGFPPTWVEQAIPYGQLKKCLKKVQSELLEIGLDPDTLRALLQPQEDGLPALRYALRSSSDDTSIQPRLTFHVRLQDGVPVDASLDPPSRRLLETLAHSPHHATLTMKEEPSPELHPGIDPRVSSTAAAAPPQGAHEPTTAGCGDVIQVPLTFDGQFFGMLQDDVHKLDELQANESAKMNAEVKALGEEVSEACQKHRFSRTDLARWRWIFEVYLDAEVFFATHEQDHGARSSAAALTQLQWFQAEVEKRNLVKQFKIRESRMAYARFLRLNAILLKNLQFQELNKIAVRKILKKFDKRTALRTAMASADMLRSHRILSKNIAVDICTHMSKSLITIVPQLSDHSCPICMSVPWRPVRLACNHVFCIRCTVKLQRAEERFCPLCRADVVLAANIGRLNLRLLFPPRSP